MPFASVRSGTEQVMFDGTTLTSFPLVALGDANGAQIGVSGNPAVVHTGLQAGARLYRAAVQVTAAASSSAFFAIYGAANRLVEVVDITVTDPTLTAIEYVTISANARSSAQAGGTAVTMAAVPYDANVAAAAAAPVVYTAAPTDGTLIGRIGIWRTRALASTPTAAGTVGEWRYPLTNGDGVGQVLRGTAQGLTLNFDAAPASAVTLTVAVTWTETTV